MAEIPTRRRVTFAQLEQLWEFLNINKNIATGYNKTAQAREFSKRMWEEVSQRLNSHGDGAVKDWKGWCKYWNDYKSKLKKMSAALRASHQRTGGGPSLVRQMTDIEKKFLNLLGEDFGQGVPGARVQPFEEVAETGGRQNDTETPSIITIQAEESSEVSQSIFILPFEEPVPGPSSRITPPPNSAPGPDGAAQAGESPLAAAPQTPLRGSPRRRRPQTVSTPRRRRMRAEPHMTQQATRRLLVQISNRRAEMEERRCTLLEQLVKELREIKEILRSRNAELPTTEELSGSL